eukprot:TRINITY_DN3471_c0_g6_i1.p1 TRINITY_DN3471_c0_g6~~TRINITY_DN3471_c0_g6_i1.p1  ORF type:complete len:552 (-),score=113.34 TRINITY_DN3471_c0_g6_i1:90-1745(-)
MLDSSNSREGLLTVDQSYSKHFFSRIFATVKFDNAGRNLKKVLNLANLIFLGISITIGSGAYSIIGIAAQRAGPSIFFSFLIVGLLCFFTCLPFAEFSAKIQSAGFSYSFIYASCGELLGYITGHYLHLANIFSGAITARCWGAYVASFIDMFGVAVPKWTYEWEIFGCRLCILGCLLVVGLTMLILNGMKESAKVNNVISTMNLTTLLFAIVAGAFYVNSEEYYKDFTPFGMKGVFSGIGLAFFAFLGFEGLTCFTEEAIKPERDMPIALVVVLIAATLLNSGVALVMTGMAPLSVMANNQSLLAVFRFACPKWMSFVISIGSIAGLTACEFTLLMCQARTFFSVACDGLLPRRFVKVNAKTQTPDFSVVSTCVVVSVITLLFDVEIAGNAVSICGLLICAVVDLGVIISRYESESSSSRIVNWLCFAFICFSLLLGFAMYFGYSLAFAVISGVAIAGIYGYIQMQPQTKMPATFVCPCVPFIPLMGALSFTLMTTTIDLEAWSIVLVYTVIGIFCYFAYGYSNSKLNPNRKPDTSLNDIPLAEIEGESR